MKKLIVKSRAQDQEGNGGKRTSKTGLMNWDDFLDSQSMTSIIAGEPTPEYSSKCPSEPGTLTNISHSLFISRDSAFKNKNERCHKMDYFAIRKITNV
jgi:hypothetical protein